MIEHLMVLFYSGVTWERLTPEEQAAFLRYIEAVSG